MPSSLFEIEHTTDMQNSLIKFDSLQDFYVRMVIVADKLRKKEFETKMSYSAFSTLNKHHRVSFLSYESLIKQYEQKIESQSFDLIL